MHPGWQFFEVLHGSQPLFLQPVVVANAMANVIATAILPKVLNMERFMRILLHRKIVRADRTPQSNIDTVPYGRAACDARSAPKIVKSGSYSHHVSIVVR